MLSPGEVCLLSIQRSFHFFQLQLQSFCHCVQCCIASCVCCMFWSRFTTLSTTSTNNFSTLSFRRCSYNGFSYRCMASCNCCSNCVIAWVALSAPVIISIACWTVACCTSHALCNAPVNSSTFQLDQNDCFQPACHTLELFVYPPVFMFNIVIHFLILPLQLFPQPLHYVVLLVQLLM